jgi:hypothetical protein
VSSHLFAHAQHRRSKRIEKAIQLVVGGVGAMREPYQEQVTTLSINCHGCAYQSKHEVIQGETVYLEVKPPNEGSVGYSSRAKVKWVQKLGGKEKFFQVAVELETYGNIWGIPSPPGDWFPPKLPEAVEAAASGRELKVVARKDLPTVPAPAPNASLDRVSQPEKSPVATSSIPPIAQLMVGLGEQIQIMANEAAAAALGNEKGRLLEEFRAQIRTEAIKTIQSTILASKEVIARQSVKELSDAHEASVRTNYAVWMKKMEEDAESARQHMLNQVKEVNRRIEGLAASATERVQHNMETARGEAVDRFVCRLRDQVAPMIADAKDTIRNLEISQSAFKKESEAIFTGLENQLEFSANESLARVQQQLDKNTAALAARTDETLSKLYQNFEKAAQNNVSSLLASLESQMTRILQERAADVSREFSSGLESYTRNYLESIGKSIAEIPRKIPVHAGK